MGENSANLVTLIRKHIRLVLLAWNLCCQLFLPQTRFQSDQNVFGKATKMFPKSTL
jgi:hypothetical protein